MSSEEQTLKPAKPRKRPVQARSALTVDAIFEATIQVVAALGMNKLTTARVAARAGVSVGALYQYYPNKQVLMVAVLERHLEQVALAVEQACAQYHGQAPGTMGRAVAAAFVDANLARPDVAGALCAVAAGREEADVVARSGSRIAAAIVAMLLTCPGRRVNEPDTVAFMLHKAMAGVMQGVLEQGAGPALSAAARIHLGQLCAAYLEQAASDL